MGTFVGDFAATRLRLAAMWMRLTDEAAREAPAARSEAQAVPDTVRPCAS